MFCTAPTLVEALSQPFKRAQQGLFHGKMKQYGNNVPFSKHKTRRTWLPNVQLKRLPSKTLGETVRVHVTTRALKTIKKHGGIDGYVAKTRSDLLGDEGMRLRLLFRSHAKEQASQAPSSGLKNSKTAELTNLIRGRQPQLQDAIAAREEAARSLGISGLASAKQTIRYLQERERKMVAELE